MRFARNDLISDEPSDVPHNLMWHIRNDAWGARHRQSGAARAVAVRVVYYISAPRMRVRSGIVADTRPY